MDSKWLIARIPTILKTIKSVALWCSINHATTHPTNLFQKLESFGTTFQIIIFCSFAHLTYGKFCACVLTVEDLISIGGGITDWRKSIHSQLIYVQSNSNFQFILEMTSSGYSDILKTSFRFVSLGWDVRSRNHICWLCIWPVSFILPESVLSKDGLISSPNGGLLFRLQKLFF